MKGLRFIIPALACLVFSAQAQEDLSPMGQATRRADRIRTDYAAQLSAAAPQFETAGYVASKGQITVAVDSTRLFSDNPQPFLHLHLQIVQPSGTDGNYDNQAVKIVRQNMMKIVRVLNASLGDVATRDDIAGICFDLTWGPNDSAANQMTILVNKYGIGPFLSGRITLNDFIARYVKLKHGSELMSLKF